MKNRQYRISELATLVGLSRTALLYYEKKGLIKGKRQANGYRVYSEQDAQRLQLILKLQAGGLTLDECQACLSSKIDRALLLQRLQQLDDEIAQKQRSRQLLAALLGEGDLKAWHQSVDEVAPDAHLQWLIAQGFTEKEALRVKWLSKDMNEHEQYMADFMRIFETLDRWGPGSEHDTLAALAKVPHAPQRLLEIGCGKGLATTLLAAHTQAQITAVDNEQSALDRLSQRAEQAGIIERIQAVAASMTELPFEDASFDLIWAEGCAYIMGVTNAFAQWRRLLQDDGVLVLSDLVWLTDTPSDAAKGFWQKDYPDMTTVSQRTAQAKAAGYSVLDSFALSDTAWQNYAGPLAKRVAQLKPEMADSAALTEIETELNIYRDHLGEFGYQIFVLQKSPSV
ncbi:methyltransferase domain-containing protein [Ferrimonas pelagia]|uniref:MerR family transcriptional regulator n=1 Tax=Ferrimonas pelagia TaxID=1177826 RepID=A0ABP9FBK6_9GAMM